MPIQNLKKVTLAVKADSRAESVPFEFIYGVGSEGLCPFEVLLADRIMGETLRLDVSGIMAEETFGHLLVPLRFALEFREVPLSFTLELEVTGVAEASNREVVQAMARSTQLSGCGGNCGCGCGE